MTMTADRAGVEKGAEWFEGEAMGVAAAAAREPTDDATGAEATGTGGAPAGEDADVRLERMERVALLYAEITAATRAFLAALAESDRHCDWAEAGGSPSLRRPWPGVRSPSPTARALTRVGTLEKSARVSSGWSVSVTPPASSPSSPTGTGCTASPAASLPRWAPS